VLGVTFVWLRIRRTVEGNSLISTIESAFRLYIWILKVAKNQFQLVCCRKHEFKPNNAQTRFASKKHKSNFAKSLSLWCVFFVAGCQNFVEGLTVVRFVN
jgi:hypothetical protein